MPKKLRLQALKAMLSAKLYEGKIRIVESEALSEPKTKHVAKLLEQFTDNKPVFLITGYNCDSNFEIAQRNARRIQIGDILCKLILEAPLTHCTS